MSQGEVNPNLRRGQGFYPDLTLTSYPNTLTSYPNTLTSQRSKEVNL